MTVIIPAFFSGSFQVPNKRKIVRIALQLSRIQLQIVCVEYSNDVFTRLHFLHLEEERRNISRSATATFAEIGNAPARGK